MSYQKGVYLFLFLPAVLCIYQLVPGKKRRILLLLAGYTFFWLISGKLLIYLLLTTVFTHYIGIWLNWIGQQQRTALAQAGSMERQELKKQYKKRQRAVLVFGILVLLCVLGYLKYYNFFVQNVSGLLSAAGSPFLFRSQNLVLPIGISFYTLQAIGYMTDVYWGKIEEGQPLGKVALFLAFFPQIMEGPISLYSQTADSLWQCRSLEARNLARGSIRIFWGLFKKMIIADRLYVLVQKIFDQYQDYSGVMIAVAAVAYTVQLYMEFSGCMDIILGSGRLFGISLPENFRQPFASRTAAEFWRRWHITLGTWLKTYVFYPVSMSRAVKKWNQFGRKRLGKYVTKLGTSALALFPVWLCNGLWHGPRWSYLFYGMYYFVILLAGVAVEPARNRILAFLHIDGDAWYWRIVQRLKTWVIIFVGELFFRANGLKAGLHMFASLFRDFSLKPLYDGTLLNLGLDRADFCAVIGGCVVVAIVGACQLRTAPEQDWLGERPLPVRWTLYYLLILAVVIFGAYGTGYQQVDLIYAGF